MKGATAMSQLLGQKAADQQVDTDNAIRLSLPHPVTITKIVARATLPMQGTRHKKHPRTCSLFKY